MTITERIDNITGIPPEYLSVAPPCPRSVKIELTGRCNFACAFCARSDMLREQKDMDPDFFRRVVADMRVFLTTNGSLATPQRVTECMEAGLDSLKFSFNYADEAQFAEIARVKPGLFVKMVQNVKAAWSVRELVAAQTGHRCGLYASYIQYDGDQGGRMRRAVDEIAGYVDEVYALPLYNQADLVSEEEKKRGWKPTAGNRGRLLGTGASRPVASPIRTSSTWAT